uniref:Uncharacterized protein n=1 Tax=Anopheles dirus TaxID=7168 RepID=A0A182NGU5_9DIPT
MKRQDSNGIKNTSRRLGGVQANETKRHSVRDMIGWRSKFLAVFYTGFALYGIAIVWLYWSGYFELDEADG